MKKLIIFCLGMTLLFGSMGCAKNTETSSESESKGGESSVTTADETRYTDIVRSPEYPEVDETGYTVYYFDGENGSDDNSGLSAAEAKKSLNGLNALVSAVTEPTKILLKAGTVFEGRAKLEGYRATAEKPLIIDKYGAEDEYPLIEGTGGTALHVLGENVRVYRLEVTNPLGTRGICVETAKEGESANIVVEGCYIHDVKWSWNFEESVEEAASDIGNYDVAKVCPDSSYNYGTAGISFCATNPTGSDIPRWFNRCWIMNNRITTVGRVGICTDSVWISGNGCDWGGKNKFRSLDDGWYPAKNLVVSGNDISYVGGDGIVTIGVEDCYIEYNKCIHAALLGRGGYACAGIWPVNARRVYIQFNEAGYTHLDNGCTDGEGFDIDIGCSDVIFQYNYSHDNDGGGLLICNVHSDMPMWDENGLPVIDDETGKQKTFESAGYWNNVRIRNNLFACNGKSGTNAAFLVMSSDCKNIICENNTVVLKPGLYSQEIINSADYGNCGKQENLVCRNNVFYAEDYQYSKIQLDYCASSVFENNLYYNFPESFFDKWTGIIDEKAIKDVDPAIEIPSDRTGYDKVELFRPGNAKVFSLGTALEELSVEDITGSSTKGKRYVGAYCA